MERARIEGLQRANERLRNLIEDSSVRFGNIDGIRQDRQGARAAASLLRRAVDRQETAIEEVVSLLARSRSRNAVDQNGVPDAERISWEAENLIASIESGLSIVVPSTMMYPPPVSCAQIKLPKFEIEKFSGDYFKFMEFWQLFSSHVHESQSYSKIDKFKLLLSHLTGKAKSLISGYRMTEENYDTVIDLLKERYGDEHVLINEHYRCLNHMPKSMSKNVKSQRETLDQIERHIRSLKNLGENIEQKLFITIIMSKFPDEINLDIEKQRLGTPLSVETLLLQLKRQVTAHERLAMLYSNDPVKDPSNKKEEPRQFTSQALVGRETPNKKCFYCNLNHWSDECRKYSTLEKRSEKIGNNCHVCFSSRHTTSNCQWDRSCFHCSKRRLHHRSLCPKLFQKAKERILIAQDQDEYHEIPEEEEEEVTETTSNNLALSEQVTLQTFSTTIVNPLDSTISNTSVRGMLDCGSHRTYITEGLSKRLKLQKKGKQFLTVYTFGKTEPTQIATYIVEFNLLLEDGSSMQITANVVPEITGNKMKNEPNLNLDIIQIRRKFKDEKIKLSNQNGNMPLELLIGNDYYLDVILKKKYEICSGLYLLETKFGYIVSGRHNKEGTSECVSFLTYSYDNEADLIFNELEWTHSSKLPVKNEKEFMKGVKQLWDLDTIGIKESPLESEDDLAISNFNSNIQFMNGRYFVSWPWRYYPPKLSSGYSLALGRLNSLLRRIQTPNSEILQKYHSIIHEQLTQGIIEEVTKNQSENHPIHYLPHHAVVTPQKTTTKVRIVFDGSAKAKRGEKSLNECLYRGRVMLEDLCGMLLRTRTHKFVITADVEKAFLQIGLHEYDRDVTRFIWIKDINKPPDENNQVIFRFQRVAFGVVSSPFLMAAVIKHHLNNTEGIVAKRMNKNFYMDNLIIGCDDQEEVWQTYKEGIDIFKLANMNLREWCTNEPNLRSRLKCEGSIKLLGINWAIQEDTLYFSFKLSLDCDRISKRQIVSEVASIFDPLGYVCPVTIGAKIFIRELWESSYSWDNSLSEEDSKKWFSLRQNLQNIADLRIPRFVGLPKGRKGELHCFSDASKQAYAFSVYLRFRDDKGYRSHLLFAKSRLAPKGATIPRLELLGVVIGTKGLKFVQDNLDCGIKSLYVWTDSNCVLHWLNSNKILPKFIENRIKEIRSFKNVIFRYVSSADNPADLATRGKVADVSNIKFWWEGPAWLSKTKEDWPDYKIDVDCVVDIQDHAEFNEGNNSSNVHLGLVEKQLHTPFSIEEHKFSSSRKLYRLTGYCLRFVQKCRKLKQTKGKLLLCKEIQQATTLWENYLQNKHFSDIIENIMSKKPNSTQIQLGLWLDKNKILRCKGRVISQTLTHDQNFPKLLPRKEWLTELTIRDLHEELGHSGVNHTLAELRKTYWVIKGRSEVRRILSKCIICRQWNGGTYKFPDMPPLPLARITRSVAFSHVGADYFGHLFVKEMGKIWKTWICLFTCLVTRGIHLELVNNLTVEEFSLAFRRFIARRGKPETITTDNAEYFKTTELVLRQNPSLLGHVDWNFIPALSPWSGGFYERLIAIVKNSMRKILGKKLLNFSQLSTITIEIEQIVNSRPLTYIADDLESNNVLTPNHFLQIRGLIEDSPDIPEAREPVFMTNKQHQLLVLWKKGEELLNNFWGIWQNEYLSSLRERKQRSIKQKRGVKRQEPRIGAVVQIGTRLPRGKWKMGRISAIRRSKDGRIRNVEVRLPHGQYLHRPVCQLYPMEVEEGESESM